MTPVAPTSATSATPVCAAASRRWSRRTLALLLVFSAAAISRPARADQGGGGDLDVGVRSEVDKPFGGFKNKDAPEHGKVFYIAQVREIHGEEKLVKPVNEQEMLQALFVELNRHGFHQVVKGQPLEIILTVEYGRGHLVNPYAAGSSMNDQADTPTQTIWSADPKAIDLLINLRAKTGYEAKFQKGQYEKLYIRVTAWQNPPPQPHKPKKLWTTTMVVDDPDHRDLNNVYKEMFAAGAGFFDHDAKEPEVDIFNPLPEGRVKVGPVEVVEPAKPKTP